MTDQGGGKSPVYPERVVLFGSEGGFSQPLLARLLSRGITVVAVVMPGVSGPQPRPGDIPVTITRPPNRAGLAGLAAAHAIPVLRSRELQEPSFRQALAELAADVLLVGCFPLRLPEAIWQSTQRVCWNLHPSLLPAYRGPAPLFWQRRNGERHTGISLHEVSGRLDAGNIVMQQPSPLPAQASEAELDEWVAAIGTELFLAALEQRRRGCLLTRPQDETAASYNPSPDQGGTHD